MSNSVGPVFWTNDRAEAYIEAGQTSGMRRIPRFGHTNEFHDLYSDNSTSYIQGLVFGFCIVIIPFLIWCILLCVFKTCVWDSYGCITGAPFTSPYDASRGRYKRWKKHTSVTRSIFIISAVIVMICSILMVAIGLGNLQDTKNVLSHTNNEINMIVDETLDISNVMIDIGRIAREVREQLYFEIGSNDKLCPGDLAFRYNPKGRQLTELAEDVKKSLEELGDFSENIWAGMANDFDDIKDQMVGYDDMVTNINRMNWLWAFGAIPLILLPSFLILGAFAAQLTFMNPSWLCCINWCLMPFFLIWLILAVIGAAFIRVAGTASADFCTGQDGTPDSTVLNLVENSGYDQSSFAYQSTRYYVHQCTEEAKVDPLLFLRDVNSNIAESATELTSFNNLIDELSISNLALVCNREYEPLQILVTTMENILGKMQDASGRALGILSCERVVPMYTNTVYNGICTSNIKGLLVVYWCLIVVCIFGWIMISTRSSYQNSNIQKHELPRQKEPYDDEAS